MVPGLVRPSLQLYNCSSPSSASSPSQPAKRKIESLSHVAAHAQETAIPPPKRVKLTAVDGTSLNASSPDVPAASDQSVVEADVSALRDVIDKEMSHAILMKHEELRFIDQEMAKCQVALEQLRRCHLIPYPTHCPTPEQMLQISSGKGPTMRKRPSDAVPRWAAPFGVVDGPYARHYAKWLIPDPAFDGASAEWQLAPIPRAAKNAPTEGRTTRNSLSDAAGPGKQPGARSHAASKGASLLSGNPQPKEKSGPCIWTRSDGTAVRMVCLDCHRGNFSSVQGFINHCRIAHKREFKSHDEAAKACGHVIEVEAPPTHRSGEQKPVAPVAIEAPAPIASAGLVHDLARVDPEVSNALVSRIKATAKVWSQNPHASAAAASSSQKPQAQSVSGFVGSDKTPFLTQLLRGKSSSVDLASSLADAQTVLEDEDDLYDESEAEPSSASATPRASLHAGGLAPSIARKPQLSLSAVASANGSAPAGRKGLAHGLSFSSTASAGLDGARDGAIYEEDEMDLDYSPNTATSNHAPSLVSDDGEYDDSDDEASSQASEDDERTVSAVTEVDIEDDGVGVADHEEASSPRDHHGSPSDVTFKKDESKPVPFVNPVAKTAGNGRRKRKA